MSDPSIPSCKQRLIFNEVTLSNDDDTMTSLGISIDANIFLILSKDVSVTIKPIWDHPNFILQMNPEATIAKLKVSIQERTGWVPR